MGAGECTYCYLRSSHKPLPLPTSIVTLLRRDCAPVGREGLSARPSTASLPPGAARARRSCGSCLELIGRNLVGGPDFSCQSCLGGDGASG